MLVYPPLLDFPAGRSTRLFTLAPGSGNAPIVGSLSSIGLGNMTSPSYEALSYTWGIEEESEGVIVDRHKHLIRRKLHDALSRLRLPTSSRPLWIDFLCIKQDDLTEKAQQVRIIGDVFYNAERVLVWVGEHDDGSEELFRPSAEVQMKRMGAFHRILGRTRLRIPSQELLRRTSICESFFSRRYFTRTWIVQELGKARAVILHCGHDSMEWLKLISSWIQTSCITFDGLKLSTWNLGALVMPLNALVGATDGYHYGEGHRGNMDRNGSIFHLMQRFSHTRCYDPGDKVFALRSLERTGETTQIIVDYDMRMSDLLVMLYDTRHVNSSFPIQPLPASKHIPDPSTIILALKVSQTQCAEALTIMEDRAKAEEDAKARKMSQEVIWLFKDFVSGFLRYGKAQPFWWTHPSADHLDFDDPNPKTKFYNCF